MIVKGFVIVRNVHTLVALCCVLFAASVWTRAATRVSPGELFDPGRAHRIEIRMSAEGWDLLQPGAAAQKAAADARAISVLELFVRMSAV